MDLILEGIKKAFWLLVSFDPEDLLRTFQDHKITFMSLPGGPGVRVDTAAYNGCVIPSHYDSLVAKLIVHGKDRAEAIAKMKRALDEFIIEGIKTTIPMHKRILADPDFQKGDISTKFMERYLNPPK